MHPTDVKGVSFLFGRWKSKQPALSFERQPKGHDLAVYKPSNIIVFAYLSSDLGKKRSHESAKGITTKLQSTTNIIKLKIQLAQEEAGSRRSFSPDEWIVEEKNNTILFPSFRGFGPRAPSIADATDSRRPWTFCFAFQKTAQCWLASSRVPCLCQLCQVWESCFFVFLQHSSTSGLAYHISIWLTELHKKWVCKTKWHNGWKSPPFPPFAEEAPVCLDHLVSFLSPNPDLPKEAEGCRMWSPNLPNLAWSGQSQRSPNWRMLSTLAEIHPRYRSVRPMYHWGSNIKDGHCSTRCCTSFPAGQNSKTSVGSLSWLR